MLHDLERNVRTNVRSVGKLEIAFVKPMRLKLDFTEQLLFRGPIVRKCKMTKATDHSDSQTIDQIRHNFSAQLAIKIRAGVDSFLIRFARRDTKPVECWIYTRQNHQWHKCDDLPVEPTSVSLLLDEMESVFQRDISDDSTCRRVDHTEHIDFELHFRRDKLATHLHGDLESFLRGTLFGGHHDTGTDSRRRMQFRGPR